MAEFRKVGSSGARSSLGTGKVGVGPSIPVGISPILRRFWDFTKKMAHEFARQLKDTDKKETDLIKEVTKRF
jgi:hypothetical protein